METKVLKWGNSVGIRIPKSFAREVGVEAGSAVDLSVAGDTLVLRPLRRLTYRLDDLLRGVTAKNRHDEIETGGAVGREAW